MKAAKAGTSPHTNHPYKARNKEYTALETKQTRSRGPTKPIPNEHTYARSTQTTTNTTETHQKPRTTPQQDHRPTTRQTGNTRHPAKADSTHHTQTSLISPTNPNP
jgi:hypothetical protein